MIEQQIFNNRYRLDRKLGEGGMATVYCGTDTLLRRRVAVKVLRQQYAADDEFVRRFYQEAESAARLSHPNIVNTYDVGREGDLYYIVMELVDGPSLAEIIAADGKLPEPVAIDYAAQICSGLAYAHRQGLLHRDIKPANILVTKDDVCKLSDFGIARAASRQTMALTKPGLVMGSVYYISPEQAQGHDLDDTSDLYSVGVVLYQMLVGQLPYEGESPVTVALKHIGHAVPTIDPALGVSPALAAVVNKLLQKEPAHRYQSASDVATALREARERPLIARHTISNDAPPSASPLPPRRSPLPDRAYAQGGGEREVQPAASGGVVWAIVALALVAAALGYWAFGRPGSAISLPPIPDLAANVRVADYRNMTDVAAQQAVVNAGLTARFIKSPSDTIPANHVIRQNPAAGTKVEKNSVVELVVSNGLPTVGLRDVRGFSVADAQRTLSDDKLTAKIVRRFDNAPKDSVLSQSPSPGSPVRQNSTVLLIVSNGPQPVTVPNFVGMTLDDAQAAGTKLGLTLDTTQRETIAGVDAGKIVSQDVQANAGVARGSVVHLVVNAAAPADMGTVPDVRGKSYPDAAAAISAAKLSPTLKYEAGSVANGTIVDEHPSPGSSVASGSSVELVLSVPGEVPDTQGMPVEQARATLAAAGYAVGPVQYTTAEGASGKVVRTDPQAGTQVAPGSSVTLVVNGTPP